MSPRKLPPSETEVMDEYRAHGIEGVYHRWLTDFGRTYLDLVVSIGRERSVSRWRGHS